jgi:hypothetical protein
LEIAGLLRFDLDDALPALLRAAGIGSNRAGATIGTDISLMVAI